MTLKGAALLAVIGIAILTVLLAVGFIRDLATFVEGASAAITLLVSLVHLLASLSLLVFLFVFYRAQR